MTSPARYTRFCQIHDAARTLAVVHDLTLALSDLDHCDPLFVNAAKRMQDARAGLPGAQAYDSPSVSGGGSASSAPERLAERIDAAGCPIAVILNKWELLSTEARHDVTWQVGQKLHFIGESPVLRISALTGRGVHRLVPALETAIDAYHRRVPTRKVNDVIRRAQQAQPGPHGVRVMYATQGATDPPTFTLFANKVVPPHYLRYLERMLREAFDLGATPIKMRVRKRSE